MNEETKNDPHVIYPPIQIFEAPSTPQERRQELPKENALNKLAVKADFPITGGTYVYHQGDKYPVKGWPFKEAVFAADNVKRAAINLMKFVGSSPTRYLMGLFFLLPKSIKEKVIRSAIVEFTDFTDIVFTRWAVYIKPNFMSDVAREFSRVGLQMAGLDESNQRLVKAIAMIIEYDDAYRYRFQDICGELNVEDLKKDPSKELVRLINIAISRDEKGTGPKIKYLRRIMPFIMSLPGVKDTILTFIQYADINKMKLDEIDMYRCLIWGDYDFAGIPLERRVEMRINIDKQWQEETKETT